MKDLEKRFRRVIGGMQGNEALVPSLGDAAAGELFSWGEATAKHIVDETDGMEDAAAEEHMAPRLRALRVMMRAVGRWVGEAKTLDLDARQALWNRAGEQARVLFGDSFELPSMEMALAQLPPDADAVRVIAWLKDFIEEKSSRG
ncbi:MAG: hypothetical protein C3F07_12770 [Anaerolineales bacterium]|nr:hypothetical protein [Anaerolineae bacterium]PWB72088.1 MAG: hypothetical protein C3F07_12770 [Anaerolineales bacterium]